MTEKIYRAAAIGHTGAGGFGHGLHQAYEGNEGVEFVAVSDPDEEGRAKAQQETGAPRSYADHERMLAAEELDIVSVGPRWPVSHVELVTACMEAGAHVYCEKPMTSNLADGDLLVARAEQLGKKIAVAHQGVYLPQASAVMKAIEGGTIGDVQAVYAHGKQDRRGGGEDMMVLGTHLFNMMRYFLGDVRWMSGHVSVDAREATPADVREPTEPIGPVAGDSIHSYFAFESGVSGHFDSRVEASRGDGMRMGMEIVGSGGIIALRGGSPDAAMLYPHGTFTPGDPDQRWVPLLDPGDGSLGTGNQLAIIDLIEAVEKDRKPVSSASDAVAALEMILGAYESHITGGRVAMPMANRSHPLPAWK